MKTRYSVVQFDEDHSIMDCDGEYESEASAVRAAKEWLTDGENGAAWGQYAEVWATNTLMTLSYDVKRTVSVEKYKA